MNSHQSSRLIIELEFHRRVGLLFVCLFALLRRKHMSIVLKILKSVGIKRKEVNIGSTLNIFFLRSWSNFSGVFKNWIFLLHIIRPISYSYCHLKYACHLIVVFRASLLSSFVILLLETKIIVAAKLNFICLNRFANY